MTSKRHSPSFHRPLGRNRPIICQLCDFSPTTAGTFVDSILALARHSSEKMNLETFCVFPEEARERHWLKRFDNEGVLYGFVPRHRSVALRIRQLLVAFDPVIFHTHFSVYDLPASFLKGAFFRSSRILWHYHNPTSSTLLQRIKDAIKFQLIAQSLGTSCIAVGDGVYHSLLNAGVRSEKLFLVQNGIDTQRFVFNDESRKHARRLLGMTDSDDTVVFLLLGWDPLRKGVDIFVKAALEVVQAAFKNAVF